MTRLPLVLLALVAAGAPAAAAEIVLDYRKPALRDAQPSRSEAERARVARALTEAPPAIREDMGPTFAMLGEGRGAFTAPGADERIYLIQRRAPVAIEPFPNAPAPVLLVLGPTGPARFYRLAKADQFQRLAAIADAGRDGRDEVLLESSFTNMGETVTDLTAVRLDPAQGAAEAFQTIPGVAADRCEGPKKQRSLSAATISRDGTGAFTAQRHRLACD
ncbi:hypothetical protein [Methylobacterium iners]|uniref:Uncharacterized protein n=1 Tax=Methylobacterium iners TaxID=418707 RepID=A0ABQ4RWR1_9HYPH|nr:hypothetical protein [Methylobacterium iners]GJD94825.1 hypothetical protein OCOJLMKI_2031 [Methylobacterium iners]